MKNILTLLFFLISISSITIGQTQIGNNLIGPSSPPSSYGWEVAVSNDGNVIAVGSPRYSTSRGRVYFYEQDGMGGLTSIGGLIGVGSVPASNPNISLTIGSRMGEGVALSGDGSRVVVGFPGLSNGGVTRVYQRSGTTWTQLGSDMVIPGNYVKGFGHAVSISADGNRIAVSNPYQNTIRIFDYNGTNWTQISAIGSTVGGGRYGWDVSLSGDGSTVIGGAYTHTSNRGRAAVFNASTGAQIGAFIDGAASNRWAGYAVAISDDGTHIAVGIPLYRNASNAAVGGVKVYENIGGVWTQEGSTLEGAATNSFFGSAVKLTYSGDRIVVGADEENSFIGKVRVYDYNGTIWTQNGMAIDGLPTPSTSSTGAEYGGAVDISNDGSVMITSGYRYSGERGYAQVFDYPPALPVELVTFRGNKIGEEVRLDWLTAWEEENEGFQVEHSRDGSRFEPVGFVAGQGTASSNNVYEFIHENPSSGVNYYRLKQMDYNGNFEYSNTIVVQMQGEEATAVFYPNPIGETLHIKTKSTTATILITDINGKTVHHSNWNGEEISLSHLSGGMYIISFITDNEKTIEKIFKE